MSKKDGGGWIPWDGGWDLPVADGTKIDVRLRCGKVFRGIPSRPWVWTHDGTLGDVVVYRIVPVSPDANGWLPIETAPLDGTIIWLANMHNLRVGCWKWGAEYVCHGSVNGGWRDYLLSEQGWASDLPYLPTHWQPLPKPPVSP